MKKPILVAVGVTTAFALIAGPLALARKDDPVIQPKAPRVFDLREQQSEDRDLRPAGTSVGDEFLLSQALSEAGTARGTAETICSFVRVVREPNRATPLAVVLQCTGVARIGEDVLTYQGVNSFTPDSPSQSRFAVTGGTGAFRDAVGEVRVTETGAGTSAMALDLP